MTIVKVQMQYSIYSCVITVLLC